MLHQTASSSKMFSAVMQAFVDERCPYITQVFAPDTPGFGGSVHLNFDTTIEQNAESIYQALRSAGITECYLYGHHTGASLAAEIAHRYPEFVCGLILHGPPLLETSEQQAAVSVRREHYPSHSLVVKGVDGSHIVTIRSTNGTSHTAAT